jgi:hypothetical protein
MTGAGLWTTAGDLARLAIAIQQAFTGRPSAVLNQASAQRMLGLQIADRGLGWQVQPSATDVRFEHGGDNIGYKCRLVA